MFLFVFSAIFFSYIYYQVLNRYQSLKLFYLTAISLHFIVLVYVYGISSEKIDDTFSMVIAVFMVSIAFGSMAHDGASAERWANRQEEERIKYNNLSTIDKEKYDKDLAQKEEKTKERRYGEINKKVMCPHCQTRGFVRKQLGTRLIRASVRGLPEPIAAGTNTKLKVTKFRCDNCETDWSVEI